MKSGKNENVKMSKRNKLLLNVLLISIAVVFCLVAILLYINFYTRVRVVLTTVSRYKSGDIKNVSMYETIDVKKGRNLSSLPSPYMEGYVFKGWYKDIDYAEPFDYNEQLNSHMQVYGKFDLVEYTVELVLDGNKKVLKNNTLNIDYTTPYTIEDTIKLPRLRDEVELSDGTIVTISDYRLQNKYGYTFQGWGESSTAATTATDHYQMKAQNITLYSVWRPIQVELRYESQNLDFTGSRISQIKGRINTENGGLTYDGNNYKTYMTLLSEFNSSVYTIPSPSDEFRNFQFVGWYLDKNFKVPLKPSQLFVKNGFFTMSRDRNENILYDRMYLGSIELTDEERAEIQSYSSTDENNSYITLFAKWTLIEYKVKFNLNLPSGRNYVNTLGMADILNNNVPEILKTDNGENIRYSKASQGDMLFGDENIKGIVYHQNYFKDVVYNESDMTGLPMYTLISWNTFRDGTGHTLNYNENDFFDKSNFQIRNGEITLYAQWRSYRRLNYYFRPDTNTQVLLATVNIEKNTMTLPSFYDLIAGVGDANRVLFTADQIRINNITRAYSLPLNRSFAGWTNSSTVFISTSKLYIPEYTYNIGNVADEEGIFLNAQGANLYTVWLANENYYTYDLGDVTNASFDENSKIKSSLFDAEDKAIVYKYDQTLGASTIITMNTKAEKYYITKTENGKDHVMWGWKTKNGTTIAGSSSIKIEFNANRSDFVYSLVSYKEKARLVATRVYLVGNVELDTETYCTQYDEQNDRSYLYLKLPAQLLVFEAIWRENVTITFDGGAADVEWVGGHSASELTMLGVSGINITMPQLPASVAKRPFYEFVGWSDVNRETYSGYYHQFVAENTIYEAGGRYPVFETDKTLYAVWRPVIFTININQLRQTSSANYSAGTVLVSKEKFEINGRKITDEILLSGEIVTFEYADGSAGTIVLNTSLTPGYGLAGWTIKAGSGEKELVKSALGYVISVKDDVNGLFKKYPSDVSDFYTNVYPKFNELKYSVTFKFDEEGVVEHTSTTINDLKYGQSVRDLLATVAVPGFKNGYEYNAWLVRGDRNQDGTIREDYYLDIPNSNLTVKSNLVVSLTAKIRTFSVKFVLTNPTTYLDEVTKIYDVKYGDTLADVVYDINANYGLNTFMGYNFYDWRVSGNGTVETMENIDSIIVSSPLEITPNYRAADLEIVYKYYSENSTNPGKIEEYRVVVKVGYYYLIDTSGFKVKPLKNDKLLVGWTYDNGQSMYTENSYVNLNIVNIYGFVDERYVDAQKYYILNLEGIWRDAVQLSFDLTGVTITGGIIPQPLIVEKGEKIYFKDIEGISKLTSGQVKRDSGLGVFTGRWADEDGNEYDAYLTSTFIEMTKHTTLKPVFEAETYTIEYYYRFSGTYNRFYVADQQIRIDYDTPLTLRTHEELATFINRDYTIAGYDCVALYLGQTAFENKDASKLLAMGSVFDFATNAEMLALAEGYSFKVYMDLRKYSTIEYYLDRDTTASITEVGIADGVEYVVGASSMTGTAADIIPTKYGYTFMGWSKTLASANIDFTNGERITYSGQFTKLYPVWQAKPVTIKYFNNDGSVEYRKIDVNFGDVVVLPNDITNEGFILSGWTDVINSDDAKFMAGSNYTASSEEEISIYAVWVRYYTITYFNGLGDSATFGEKIIAGEQYNLKTFIETAMPARKASVFNCWSLNSATVIPVVSFTINSRTGNMVYLDVDTITMDSETDYNIKIYAVWDISYFSAQFTTYDAIGQTSTLYGKIGSPTIFVDTLTQYEYDETDYTFTFPSTASEYLVEGVTYKFTGNWVDENGKSYTNSVVINFTKNHTFTPVYKAVFELKFMCGSQVVFSTDAYLNGSVFSFNNTDLVTAVNTYNSTLSGTKLIGWVADGLYYSNLTSGQNGYNYAAWNSSVLVDKSITFEGVVEKLLTLNIYKNINYNENVFTFDESTKIEISNLIKGDTVDLNGYILGGDYKTKGWVVTSNPSYVYNFNAANLKMQAELNNDLVGEESAVYAYPVIQVKVSYAVDVVSDIKAEQYISMGDVAPTVGVVLNDDYYLDEWYIDGALYNNEPITKPVVLLAKAMPFYAIQLDDSDRRVSGWNQNKLTPKSQITLPDETDVTYNRNNFTITGWYINNYGTSKFVMNGATRKVYSFGDTLTVNDLISIGLDPENKTYGLVPIFKYHTTNFVLANVYDAITYTISASDGRTYYTTNSDNNFVFAVLNDAAASSNNTNIIFEAYLLDAKGDVVVENYNAVRSIVTIGRKLTEGYEAYTLNDGWFYYPSLIKVGASFTFKADTVITANTPTANDVNITLGLADENNRIVYNTSRAGFVSGETETFTYSLVSKAGQVVSVKINVKDGYEFTGTLLDENLAVSSFKATITASGNEITVSFRATSNLNLYLVVAPNANVKLKFVLNTSGVSNLDIANIGGTVKVYYNDNYSWRLLQEVSLNSLQSVTALSNTVPNGTRVKIVAELNSIKYFVKSIVVTGSFNNTTSNTYMISDISVGLAPLFTIELANRKVQIGVADSSGTVSIISPAAVIENQISLPYPAATEKENMTFGGYKVGGGFSSDNTNFAIFITSAKSVNSDVLILDTVQVESDTYTLVLTPVYYYNSLNITIKAEAGKALVNGETSKVFSVPYNSNVAVNENTITLQSGKITLDENGDIDMSGITEVNVTLTPIGSYVFSGWVSGATTITSFVVASDTEITGVVEAGDMSVKATISDFNGKDSKNVEDYKVVEFYINSEPKTTYYYSNLNDILRVTTKTANEITLTYSVFSGFEFVNYIITYNGNVSSNYSKLKEFALANGLNITESTGSIIINNAIFDVDINVVIKKSNYNVSIQLVESSQSSDEQDTLYANLKSSGETFAYYGLLNANNTVPFVAEVVSSGAFRNELVIKILPNSKYFYIDKIYINNSSNMVYPTKTCRFASFDAANNQIVTYIGGDSAADISICIEVKFVEMRVAFHKPSGLEFGTSELSGGTINPSSKFNFGETYSFSASDFVSINNAFSENGRNYRLDGWLYYSGNYETDLASGTVDFSKLKEITSLSYTFNLANGNLHLFGSWSDLYSVKFQPNASGVNNLPGDVNNIVLSDTLNIGSIPTQNGFNFAGYVYIFDGTTYTLNYIGGKFEKLVDESGNEVAVDTNDIVADALKLTQLLTSGQLNSTALNSFEIILQAQWTPKDINITLEYDSSMGSITEQIYNGSSYIDGTINFNYRDTLKHQAILDGETTKYALIVLDYNNNIKGRLIAENNAENNYEFKNWLLNGSVIYLDDLVLVTSDGVVKLECWGSYVNHTINLTWDALFKDKVKGSSYGSLGGENKAQVDYSIVVTYSFIDLSSNLSTLEKVAIATINGSLGEINKVSSSKTITLNNNFDITSILVKLRKGYGALIKIDLTNTPYQINDSKIYETTINTLVADEVSLDATIPEKQITVTHSGSVANYGEYEIIYYTPVKTGNRITDYTQNVVKYSAVVAGNNVFTTTADADIVLGYSNNDYVLTSVNVGGKSVAIKNGSATVTTLFNSADETVALSFDYKYIEYKFVIGGYTYASAYFTTLDSAKLVAFYKLINYGFNNIDSSVLNVLASDFTANAPTNIIKNGTTKEYYTLEELSEKYKYAVNDNIAKNSVFKNEPQLIHAWFEEWLLEPTFGTGTGEDNLTVSGLTTVATINAGKNLALIFNISTALNDDALGGIKYEELSDKTYSYTVMSSTVGYSDGYDNYCKSLTLKVKDNTYLPQLLLGLDKNTYIVDKTQLLQSNGKIFSSSMSGVNILTCDDDYNFSAVVSLGVKKVNISLVTNVPLLNETYTATVTYATTYESIISKFSLPINYNLLDSNESSYYSLIGFFVGEKQIDLTSETFESYLQSLNSAYINDLQLNIVAKYQKYDKVALTINAVGTANGAVDNSLSYSTTLYYVAGTSISGSYTGDFSTYEKNSYKLQTLINTTNINFNSKNNSAVLNGNSIVVNSNYFVNTFVDANSADYQFNGKAFVYFSTSETDTGLNPAAAYMVKLKLTSGVTPVNLVDETKLKETLTNYENTELVLSGNMTLYAVYVPVFNVALKSQNYLDVSSGFEKTIAKAEYTYSTLSSLVTTYYNASTAAGHDLSNLEVDYVVVNGVSYSLIDAGKYNIFAFDGDVTIEIVWKERV